ncbi:hypothetical protein [Amaricoccus macauensis]|uniref:hypothetical protein n=1 Tax=Amaricoccus macauensis TaxID=57001 RepID=UPI003C7CCD6C
MSSGVANKYLTYQDAGHTGFWRGVAAGIAASVVVLLVLAIIFPPTVYEPPSLAPEADQPPDAITSPDAAAATPAEPGRVGPLVVEAPAPLLSEVPPGDTPPGLEILDLPAAPDVFDGGEAGSPSLFRPAEGAESAQPTR